MRKLGFIALLGAFLFGCKDPVPPPPAELHRDQGQIFDTTGVVELGTNQFAQTITTGKRGFLAAIEVQYELFGTVKPVRFSIYAGDDSPVGEPIYTQRVRAPQRDQDGVYRWKLPRMEALNFESGTMFTFAFKAENSGVIFAASKQPDYEGGLLLQNGMPSPQAGDLAFVTYVVN